MNIKINGNLPPFMRNGVSNDIQGKKTDDSCKREKFDKVEISKDAQKFAEAAEAAARLRAELAQEPAAEKLLFLRGQINNNTYDVPSSDIAAAILEGVVRE